MKDNVFFYNDNYNDELNRTYIEMSSLSNSLTDSYIDINVTMDNGKPKQESPLSSYDYELCFDLYKLTPYDLMLKGYDNKEIKMNLNLLKSRKQELSFTMFDLKKLENDLKPFKCGINFYSTQNYLNKRDDELDGQLFRMIFKDYLNLNEKKLQIENEIENIDNWFLSDQVKC